MKDKSKAKHVLITGASTGFGESLTYAYAKAGWNVTATMRNTSKAPKAFTELGSVWVTALDITNEKSIAEAVSAARATFGPIDVLENVAGVSIGGTLEETSMDQIRAAFETNVFGTLTITKAVLPEMRKRGTGHIFVFSSAAGVVAMPTFPTYCSTKFALEGYFEALSYELAGKGVKVTIIQPGVFPTALGAKSIQPETPMAEYASDGNLLIDMLDFTPSDLGPASEAIVAISDRDDAPVRLYVGHGLDSVRKRFHKHLYEYDTTESITQKTMSITKL